MVPHKNDVRFSPTAQSKRESLGAPKDAQDAPGASDTAGAPGDNALDAEADTEAAKPSVDDLERQYDSTEENKADPFIQDLQYLGEVYRRESDGARTDAPISVPIMWNSELTPYFHFDLSGALSSASYHVAQDSV